MNIKKLASNTLVGTDLRWKEFCKKNNFLQWHKKELLHLITTYHEIQALIRDENEFSNTENKLIQELRRLWTHEDLIHNFHFYPQHFNNWVHPKELVADPFEQISYPREEKHQNLVNMIQTYLNYNLEITKEDQKNLDEVIENIYNGKNVFLYTNHISLANIPILLKMLENSAEKLWKNDFKEHCYTTLGGLIMTSKSSRNLILWQSHILKTHPKTQSGHIELLEKEQTRQRKKYFLEIKRLCEDTINKWWIWKLFVTAPSGTRDFLIREWWNPQVFTGDDNTESEKSSLQLLSIILEKIDPNAAVSMIWINEMNLKDHDNKWMRNEDVYVSTKNPSLLQIKQLIQEKEFMPTLAGLVIDESWKSIAQAIDSEELKQLKTDFKQTFQTK